MLNRIKWLGHDTFLIDYEGKIIYIDPFNITVEMPEADYIFITHSHYDHFSKDDIKRIEKENTIIIAPYDVINQIRNHKTVVAKIGEEIELKDFKFKTVPAYNIDKYFHPKANKWVGYILNIAGVKVYHSGDTDRIPEMQDMNVDIALLPVSGTYVMTAEEAAEAALDIKPDVAIPMHYGSIIGNKSDAERFAKLLKDKIQVKIFDIGL
ncbi:MBL fold metallo-hydrolase [candidate division WOR-3 bacterium]|jgi:L-ascorbate metabolism protein UlaG (beta-lactamase superfamily)|nr:MBL fold metallo-hydrolase [candidate division WOR-3 bacterium]